MTWTVVKLASVADIERSGVQPDSIVDGTRYLGLEHIESGGQIIGGDPVNKGDLASSKFTFSDEHVLYGKLRPYLAKIALPDFEGVCSTDILPIRPKAGLDRGYLAYFLRQPDMVAKANSLATGANLPRINPKALEQIEIPLPSLEEQKRIAGILDQADALRRLRARALEKLNTLGQAVFQEMFGDELNKQPNESTQKIGDLCHRLSVGVVIKPASYYVDEGVPAIRGTNIKPQGINLNDVVYFSEADSEGPLKKSVLRKGDVVAVRSGRPGLAAVVPEELDGANSIDILFATPDVEKLLPRFLCDFMNSPIGKRKVFSEARGQVQQHFNVKSWSETEINLPSLKQQIVYANKIADIKEQSVLLEAASGKAEATFASLQSAAFQGKL